MAAPNPLLPLAPNYASTRQDNIENFCKYLHKSCDNGLSYTIHVNYHQMMTLAGLDLTMATFNDKKHREGYFLLPAARQFLKEKNLGNEEERLNKTSLYYSEFPMSMQKIQDFKLVGALVETVCLFGKHLSVDSPTASGRHFLQMLLALLFENYSKGIFLDGEFDTDKIVIFNYGLPSPRIEILQKPAEADNWTAKMCDEAKVKDMGRVADLINSHYMKADGSLPLYFGRLVSDLQKVTYEEVGKPSFRKYLCYHVAFMHSDGRRHLEIMLHSIYTNCKGFYIPFMAHKPTVYPSDWRKKVNTPGKHYIGGVLNKVYKYHSTPHQTDPYENSVRGLMKFKRNVLEHGGQYIHIESHHLWHLELCAAYIFSEFLPSLVRTLLEQSGLMESTFADAWEGFKRQGLR